MSGNIDYFPGVRPGEFQGNRKGYVDDAVHTDAGAEYYKHYLGVELDSLVGKKVLDIGGAPGGEFSRDAKASGVDIVTINASEEQTMIENKYKSIKTPTAVAYAQELPFPDNTFDEELAFASVPGYLPKYESEYRATFSEMLRTVKPEGVIHIFPILGTIYDSNVFKQIIHDFENQAKFEFEKLHEWEVEDVMQPVYRLDITKLGQEHE